MDCLRFRYIVFCFLHVFIRLPPCPFLSICMLVHLWETLNVHTLRQFGDLASKELAGSHMGSLRVVHDVHRFV